MKHHNRQYATMLAVMRMLLMVAVLFGADTAWACSGVGTACVSGKGWPGTCDTSGNCQENPDPDGTCTFDDSYLITYPASGTGTVNQIITYITNAVSGMSQQMFQAIVGDTLYQHAVIAALILFMIVYSVCFMFAIIQITVYDFFIRMVKVCIAGALLNGTAWNLFSQTVVKFFNNGTDSIIQQVSTNIVASGMELGGKPFDWIDNSIVEMTSVKMLVTLMAATTTGPYGIVIILLLIVGFYTFLKAMLNAIWVYIFALVMRTLLFGLAPVFLACVLFSRTRQLFDGWLNQVLNSCLQPIFLFAFFSFFVVLIKTQLDAILNLDVCWTQVALFTGPVREPHYWRFAMYSGGKWIPFDGIWGLGGPEGAVNSSGNPVHPVGIMLPLTLWLLSDLAKRFNEIVAQVARDIANASTSFKFEGGGFANQALGAGSGNGSGGALGSGVKPNPAGRADARASRPNQGRTAAQQAARMRELAATRRNPTPPPRR